MKKVLLNEVPYNGLSHDPAILKQELLKKGDVPHLTNFSVASISPGTATTPHHHADMFELFFVTSGSGRAIVDGEQIALEAGTLLLVEPGEQHRLISAAGSELTVIYLGITSSKG
jgi:mannose-6-phosphate isomerase-like protein (cupin superfamily)